LGRHKAIRCDVKIATSHTLHTANSKQISVTIAKVKQYGAHHSVAVIVWD